VVVILVVRVLVVGAAVVGFSRGLGAERRAAKLPEFCPAIGRLIGVVGGGGGGGGFTTLGGGGGGRRAKAGGAIREEASATTAAAANVLRECPNENGGADIINRTEFLA
jgi:hypothetical protein